MTDSNKCTYQEFFLLEQSPRKVAIASNRKAKPILIVTKQAMVFIVKSLSATSGFIRLAIPKRRKNALKRSPIKISITPNAVEIRISKNAIKVKFSMI